MRLLWIFGKYGQVETEKQTHLKVDAETYLANRGREKTLAIWTFVENVVLKGLSEFGVCCERVALQGVMGKDLTTGTGYLRKKGWIMRVSFEEKIGGTTALKTLQTYANKLHEKYGSRAFQHFRKADMTIFTKK